MNIIFNSDKKLLIPQFNFQEMAHSGLYTKKYIAAVDKNRKIPSPKELLLEPENVDTEIEKRTIEHEQTNSREEANPNSNISHIPSSLNEETLPDSRNSDSDRLPTSEDCNNITSIPAKPASYISSFDPNQKRNYHIYSYSPLSPPKKTLAYFYSTSEKNKSDPMNSPNTNIVSLS
ncbi:hypothetical protein GcM1_121009, partial [Golovinomyces cichoracearum]